MLLALLLFCYIILPFTSCPPIPSRQREKYAERMQIFAFELAAFHLRREEKKPQIHEFDLFFCCWCLFNLEQIFSGGWNSRADNSRRRNEGRRKIEKWHAHHVSFRFVSLLFPFFFALLANIDVWPWRDKNVTHVRLFFRFRTRNSIRSLIFYSYTSVRWIRIKIHYLYAKEFRLARTHTHTQYMRTGRYSWHGNMGATKTTATTRGFRA